MSSSADKAVMWLGPPLIAAVTILYAIAAPVLSGPEERTLADARQIQEQRRRDGGTVSWVQRGDVITNLECSVRGRHD